MGVIFAGLSVGIVSRLTRIDAINWELVGLRNRVERMLEGGVIYAWFGSEG